MSEASPWMTRPEVAAYLQVGVRTLEDWARQGDGPPYHKLRGRLVRYHKADVDAWAQQGRRLHTADDGHAAQVLAEAEALTRRPRP